jgi:hypothetical protein
VVQPYGVLHLVYTVGVFGINEGRADVLLDFVLRAILSSGGRTVNRSVVEGELCS